MVCANKPAVAAARAATKIRIRENEAEKLYAEAVELLKQREVYDLKPLVEKLKARIREHRRSHRHLREPPFAELARAVSNLGKIITVRLDGKGDFKSIHAVLDAAPPAA